MAKQPDLTADQARERLSNAQIPDRAKQVMGGQIPGGKPAGTAGATTGGATE